MDWVIGVDVSTVSVAMVAMPVPDNHRYIYSKHKLSRGPAGVSEASTYARSFVRRLIGQPGVSGISLACVEAPVLARANPQTTIKQSMVNGAVQAGLLSSPEVSDLLTVPPATWKKRVLGHGNLDKPGITAAALALCPDLEDFNGDQDLIDAWCVASYSASLCVLVGLGIDP